MVKSLIAKQIDQQEKGLGVPLDYIRHILQTSLGSFFKFGLFMPLAQHRKRLPAEAYAVARIVAARDEDCGTCVQLEVNQARDQGVSTEILQAVLDKAIQKNKLPSHGRREHSLMRRLPETPGVRERLLRGYLFSWHSLTRQRR